MTFECTIERNAPDKNIMYIRIHPVGDPRVYVLTDAELTNLMVLTKTVYTDYIKVRA
jgi:hypothetical protein